MPTNVDTNAFFMDKDRADSLAQRLGASVFQAPTGGGGPFSWPGSTYLVFSGGKRMPATVVQRDLDRLAQDYARGKKNIETNLRFNKNFTPMSLRSPEEAYKMWVASGGYESGLQPSAFLETNVPVQRPQPQQPQPQPRIPEPQRPQQQQQPSTGRQSQSQRQLQSQPSISQSQPQTPQPQTPQFQPPPQAMPFPIPATPQPSLQATLGGLDQDKFAKFIMLVQLLNLLRRRF